MLPNLHITDGNRASIVVDTPTVLLDTVDALGVGADIINVERQHTVVSVDVDMVGVVGRTFKPVAVGGLDKTFAFLAFLLEIELAVVIVLWVYHYRIVLLRICTTNEGDAEFVPVVGSLDSKGKVVCGAEAGEENVGIVAGHL